MGACASSASAAAPPPPASAAAPPPPASAAAASPARHTLYGASWCPYTQKQLQLIRAAGAAGDFDVVLCDEAPRGACGSVTMYPTLALRDGRWLAGGQSDGT